MNNQPIGIFDSGIGGLSILGEIKSTLPNENLSQDTSDLDDEIPF